MTIGWVEAIPRQSWIGFFETLGLSLHIDDSRILRQLLLALNTLSFQVAQLGLEKEVLHYLPDEFREQNPFVQQSYLVHRLEGALPATNERHGELLSIAAGIKTAVDRCHSCIGHIRENYSLKGASLHQTYMLLLLANRLERISILVDLLDQDHPERTTGPLAEGTTSDSARNGATIRNSVASALDTGKFVDFFRMLIRYENRKNSLFEFLSQSMGYLAYQIAEHKGAKGNKYITTTPAEYRSMFQSAMGGGAWICAVVLVKHLLIRLPMAIFWRGFAFSVNYSLGFVLIEETHATLATKQPAFTASAVAGSLDARKNAGQPNLYNLALTVARVSRSQIASFVGNLIVVFPGAYLVAWGYDALFGKKLVDGPEALRLLQDQHPWQSLSLLYACNTGVFLFLSGIIAGYVQNKIRYGHIGQRLQTHPVLAVVHARRKTPASGRICGEPCRSVGRQYLFGVFPGYGGFFWRDLRHPVRHPSYYDLCGKCLAGGVWLGFSPDRSLVSGDCIPGRCLAIGFLNFLVSFSLAFFVAVRSRGIRLRDYPEFLGILGRYFIRRPLDFIRPGRRPVEE